MRSEYPGFAVSRSPAEPLTVFFFSSPAKEDQSEDPVPGASKPAENAAGEAKTEEREPSPPPRTPLRTKTTAALATDKLVSLSPAVPASTQAQKKARDKMTNSINWTVWGKRKYFQSKDFCSAWNSEFLENLKKFSNFYCIYV